VLSLGCGDDPYVVSPLQSALGGKLTWYDLIFAAMRLQSLSATNQARLQLGPPAVRRIDPPANPNPIMLDDFRRSLDELVPAARTAVDQHGALLAADFLAGPVDRFVPVLPGLIELYASSFRSRLHLSLRMTIRLTVLVHVCPRGGSGSQARQAR
jgi:hypothetical protein